MEKFGGPYDREPYENARETDVENGGYEAEPAARGGYDPGYGQSPYSQSPYGQSPYNASYDGGYEQGVRGGGPYSREYAQSGYGREEARAPRDRGDYDRGGERYDEGNYDRGERYDGGRYERGAERYDGGNYDRGGERYERGGDDARASYGREAYGRESYDRQDYDQQSYERGDDARAGYGRESYDRQGYGRQDDGRGYGADAYDRNYGRAQESYGNTGRIERPRGDDLYANMSDTARMRLSDTARLRMQQSDYEAYGADAGADDHTAAYDDSYNDGYEEPREARPRKKKKRSKFSRFMRGLGAYIAELPAKTLILFGGGVAVLLVGVILLVMLLPKTPEQAEITDGQLALSDMTPTPSLPPTTEPELTPEISASPSPDPDPLNGVTLAKVGETNDILPTVQERLVTLGYMDMPEGGYTTTYGPATKTAVRLFQIKNLTDYKEWDGVLGAGTYSLLMSDTAQAFYLSRGDGDDRTKEITRLVELVKQLQERLISLGYLAAGSATGRYGESTVTAVRTFQQFHGLKADGLAGQATLKQIYAADAMDATTGAANDRSKLTPTPAVDPATAAAGAAVAASPDAAATNAAAVPTPTVNEDGIVVY